MTRPLKPPLQQRDRDALDGVVGEMKRPPLSSLWATTLGLRLLLHDAPPPMPVLPRPLPRPRPHPWPRPTSPATQPTPPAPAAVSGLGGGAGAGPAPACGSGVLGGLPHSGRLTHPSPEDPAGPSKPRRSSSPRPSPNRNSSSSAAACQDSPAPPALKTVPWMLHAAMPAVPQLLPATAYPKNLKTVPWVLPAATISTPPGSKQGYSFKNFPVRQQATRRVHFLDFVMLGRKHGSKHRSRQQAAHTV